MKCPSHKLVLQSLPNPQEFVGAPDHVEHPEGLSQPLSQVMWLKKATPQKHPNCEAEKCSQIGFWHLYLWRYVSIRKHLWVKLIHGLYWEGGGEKDEMMKSL